MFRAVKAAIGDGDRPEHFSIEQAPVTLEGLVARNAELLDLGITPIWYPKGEYDKVGAILGHARNERTHKRSDNPRNGLPAARLTQPQSPDTSPPELHAHSVGGPVAPPHQQSSLQTRLLNAILALLRIRFQ